MAVLIKLLLYITKIAEKKNIKLIYSKFIQNLIIKILSKWVD